MVDSCWYAYTIPPDHVFIDAIILWAYSVFQWCDSKSFFEQKDTHCFHHGDGVDLAIEQGLLSPHASDEEFLLFEKKWEHTVQDVDCSLYFGKLFFVFETLGLGCSLMHGLHSM